MNASIWKSSTIGTPTLHRGLCPVVPSLLSGPRPGRQTLPVEHPHIGQCQSTHLHGCPFLPTTRQNHIRPSASDYDRRALELASAPASQESDYMPPARALKLLQFLRAEFSLTSPQFLDLRKPWRPSRLTPTGPGNSLQMRPAHHWMPRRTVLRKFGSA